MTEISAKNRLRPTRIAFLVHPSDKKSIRNIMRINACLWGGQYNPIIPIYKIAPKDWREKGAKQLTGEQVAKGYVEFFEPDVYVEAEEGLLEKAGLGALRSDGFDKTIILLSQFFNEEYRGIYDPSFGQSIFDVIDDTYLNEQRFQLRDAQLVYYSKKQNDIFAELCMGVYPELNTTEHIKTAYHDVYKPEKVVLNSDIWLKIFRNECTTPFSVTDKFLDIERSWHDEPIIYIFNPTKTTDLIDLWNMRIQPAPIYPVPMDWVSELSSHLIKFIKRNFRPLKHNPNGVMHYTTIEVSRSISEESAKREFLHYFAGLPKGSLHYKFWRTAIWQVDYKNQFIAQPKKVKLTVAEKDEVLLIKDSSYLHSEFEVLSPSFSDRYSGSRKRWANILTIHHYSKDANVATCIPFNTYDKGWPSIGIDKFSIGREGWVYLQDYKDSKQFVSFLGNDEAFLKWFEYKDLSASLSEAGRIAKQVLDSLQGLWGLYLVDDIDSIQFINKIAKSARQVASIDQWTKMINIRKANGSHHRVELSDYIKRSVVTIGLESDCSYCYATNWHGLDEVSYQVKCTRCLKHYDFPQAEIQSYNRNWKYRVIGPFAIPDYAQGAYTSLLTIRFFTQFRNLDTPSSYSTALDIKHDGKDFEVDFAIWTSDESGFDINPEPRLIIGEAKSFAFEAIKKEDLDHLKATAELIPNSILVISVLKESFSDNEISLLKEFVEWSRKSSSYGPKHLVILLTATELFNQFLSDTWKKKGEPYSSFSDYHSTRTLESLSNSTLSIYLNEKSYHDWYVSTKRTT